MADSTVKTMKKTLPAFAADVRNPWCDGCGHTPVVRKLQDGLSENFKPRNVVLVTDIGCIGMTDRLMTCHTVHGLHGRAPALAAGIAMTRPDDKIKVVALMGDGGAAIGLQHIMECAKLNLDMTLVVCNNQTYGMTGGQHSAYTLRGVRTSTTPEGVDNSGFDLVKILSSFGVQRARTLATSKELPDYIEKCLNHKGFSLLETMNYCPSYSGKFNPETLTPRAMKEFFAAHGLEMGFWPSTYDDKPFNFEGRFKNLEPLEMEQKYSTTLDKPKQVLLAGSAGGGVQRASEVFAKAAIMSGLHVSFRGEYPVTVGKGFSAAVLVVSPEPIMSTVKEHYDCGIIVSSDGLAFAGNQLKSCETVVMDAKLEKDGIESRKVDFRRFGKKQAALASMIWFLQEYKYFPLEALKEAIESLRYQKTRGNFLKIFEEITSGE